VAIIDDFKLRFPPPEFSTADVDLKLPALIATYTCYYNAPFITDCDKEIILQLLAHLLFRELLVTQQPIQAESSHSAGNVSESFNSPMAGNLIYFFNTSKYGQIFVILTSKRIGGVFV